MTSNLAVAETPKPIDVPADDTAAAARRWFKTLSQYRIPSVSRSLIEIGITVGPFLSLFIAALWATTVSWWLAAPLTLACSVFLMRMFLIQHDCGHASFFTSRRANDWVGRVVGVFTMTPYRLWRDSHQIHHAGHGNLEHRGIGDIFTLTVEEFQALSPLKRIAYRVYRHPVVMFGLGPAAVFILQQRIPLGMWQAKYWLSCLGTNLGIAAILTAGALTVGLIPTLIVWATAVTLAATAGVWLFYVQHQFEDAVWDEAKDWNVHEAALFGSTHYDLPQPLRWITANIGIHHVHHLYSRIPYYRLPAVLRDHPELADVRRLTLGESLKTAKLKLWDTQTRKMVGFSAVS
ncbi:MAG: fatty acid desaturase [Pseudomonadota bacterium]